MPVQKNLEMLDALFKYASEGIIISDKKGEIIMANPAALRQFGYEDEGLEGKTIEDLVPRNLVHKHTQHRAEYMGQPHPRSMGKGIDLYARRKDESVFPVEISLSNFATTEGDYVMSFIVDITERKKHEKELQRALDEISKLNEDLEKRVQERTIELVNAITELARSKEEVMKSLYKEKDLNELKSRFVTMASHEFRTPLATILSSVSLIGRYQATEEQDKRTKHIERIKSSVSNLTEILNNFLSLGKLEEGLIQCNPSPLFLDDFVREIVEDSRSLLKNGQTIAYHSSIQESLFHLDKQLLKNILLNLISNAIKYSPENTEITISSDLKNQKLHLKVADNGIGISDADQKHLFERFFRAKNAENIQGTGLGLNIVKKYAELMNAEITLDSALGKGSTFCLTVPV